MPKLVVSVQRTDNPSAPMLSKVSDQKEANSLFLFHAELEGGEPCTSHSHSHSPPVPAPSPNDYSTFLSSRPQTLETDAIALITRCAAQHPTLRTHIVHLSAGSALPQIRAARQAGLPLTVETCFHYLVLSAEQIAQGNTLYKCCPPIREQSNRDLLWQALLDGDIDFVVSDHSPCTVELKRLEEGDFMQAWGGIGGLGLGLSLLWTEACRRSSESQNGSSTTIPMEKVLEWVSERPARQVGIDHVKGRIQVGHDADLVIFDPNLVFTVSVPSILSSTSRPNNMRTRFTGPHHT